MKEHYDIIIQKLERDKLRFSEDLKFYVDKAEDNDMARIGYTKAKACKDYCSDLIEFFREVRNNL